MGDHDVGASGLPLTTHLGRFLYDVLSCGYQAKAGEERKCMETIEKNVRSSITIPM